MSCSVNRKNYPTSLKGQKWSWKRTFGRGTSGGNEWTFTTDTDFVEKSWYSGGAYIVFDYSGIYYYDEKSKTVFLKYDKNQQLKLKKPYKPSGKKAIQLVNTNNKLMPKFYTNWILENTQLKPINPQEIPTDSLVITDLKETFNFKIEKEEMGN